MIKLAEIEHLSALARSKIDSVRKTLRICLVKQVTYPDLYTAPLGATNADVIYSSNLRSGPVAFFTQFVTDFVTVNVAEDVECSIWREKVYHCEHGPLELFLNLRSNPYVMGTVANGAYAVDVDDVDWSVYDIVVSFDIAVPRRIVDKHKNILWCYYITEGCMGSYSVSGWRSIAGYDCFLNMAFRLETALAPHEVSAPYHLHYYGCFGDLDPELAIDDNSKSGVVLDTTSRHSVPPDILEKIGSRFRLHQSGGNIKTHLSGLCRARYYLRIGGGAKQGNAIPEAVSAGCLFLTNPGDFNNADLFTGDTFVGSWEAAIEALTRFEEDPERFRTAVDQQRLQIDYTCFLRPTADLVQRLEHKRKA